MQLRVMPLLLALTIAQSLLAATSPWFGTWRLNQEKSTLSGDTYTVEKIPGGYHFGEAGLQYELLEDGKDHPVMADATSSLTKTGPNEWLRVNKARGVEVSRTKWELSNDGKTLTLTNTGTDANGMSYKTVGVVTRVGAGSGAAGTWKQGKRTTSEPATMILSDAGGGKIKVEYVESKTTRVMTFDGKPVVSSGPRVSADATATFQRVSPTEFKYTELIKGKPFVVGMETVSADGKVIKDVNWVEGKPEGKYIEIWEKQ